MNTLSIAGEVGIVKWGYHAAAHLTSWSIAANSTGGGSLTATVTQSDAFRVSQHPLTFVVPRPTGPPWTWPITSLQIVGTALSASLSPQE